MGKVDLITHMEGCGLHCIWPGKVGVQAACQLRCSLKSRIFKIAINAYSQKSMEIIRAGDAGTLFVEGCCPF